MSWISATAEKIGIAKPRFFAGKVQSRSRSSAEHMWPSVIAGINTLSTITSSRQDFQLVTPRAYQFLSVFAASTFTSNVAVKTFSPVSYDVDADCLLRFLVLSPQLLAL